MRMPLPLPLHCDMDVDAFQKGKSPAAYARSPSEVIISTSVFDATSAMPIDADGSVTEENASTRFIRSDSAPDQDRDITALYSTSKYHIVLYIAFCAPLFIAEFRYLYTTPIAGVFFFCFFFAVGRGHSRERPPSVPSRPQAFVLS